MKVYHDKRHCPMCRRGDKNEVTHPYQHIRLTLPYIRSKPFKLYGRKRGQGFKDGIEAYLFMREIAPKIEEKAFFPEQATDQEGGIFSFGAFFERHMRGKYKYYQKHLSYFWSIPIVTIDRLTLKRFQGHLKEGTLKESSRNIVLRIVRATLSEAMQQGVIDTIPVFPRQEAEHRKEKRWLSPDEQWTVIDHLPQPDRALFTFLALHGKRFSEAASLTWDKFDFRKHAVLIHESKVKKERWLALHPDFEAMLTPIPIVLRGKVFNCAIERARRILYRACRECGLPELGTHEFGRHSFVQQRVEAGLTDAEINSVTNNLANMKVYAKSNLPLQRKVLAACRMPEKGSGAQ